MYCQLPRRSSHLEGRRCPVSGRSVSHESFPLPKSFALWRQRAVRKTAQYTRRRTNQRRPLPTHRIHDIQFRLCTSTPVRSLGTQSGEGQPIKWSRRGQAPFRTCDACMIKGFRLSGNRSLSIEQRVLQREPKSVVKFGIVMSHEDSRIAKVLSSGKSQKMANWYSGVFDR